MKRRGKRPLRTMATDGEETGNIWRRALKVLTVRPSVHGDNGLYKIMDLYDNKRLERPGRVRMIVDGADGQTINNGQRWPVNEREGNEKTKDFCLI